MTDSQDFPPAEAPTRRSLRDGGSTPPSAAPGGGLRGLIAKHPTAWLASALAVVFLLLATGAVFAGLASGSGRDAAAGPSGTAQPLRPQPSTAPAGTPLRTCSIADAASNPLFGTLSASVINASTGEVLLDRNGAAGQAPASVMMMLTAAAAIEALGPATQLSTRVLQGSSPGSIVLVGGGDPTLATTPNSFYDGAPQLSVLAEAAVDKYHELNPGQDITQIVLDSTMWDPADKWDDAWSPSLISDGYQPYITALMVDGDRADPTKSVSPRGNDPIARAGEAFAAAAGLEDASFSRGAAVGTTVLAEVKSQPVSTLVSQMLATNDNTLAEMLARVVSKTVGLNGASATVGQALAGALGPLEIADSGTITVKDGSGESPLSTVPPLFFARLAAKAQANEKDLGLVYGAMPSKDSLVALPGVIANERSLAGVVTGADGTPLAFAFYAMGEATMARETTAALEGLAAAAGACGTNLSTN